MTLSFKDVLAAEAESSLLNTNEFAEEISHTHPVNGTATIAAIVDYDALDAASSVVTDQNGTRIRSRAVIEILASIEVAEEKPGGAYPSTFSIDGYLWLAKRVIGKDAATQSVEVHRTDQKATKRI